MQSGRSSDLFLLPSLPSASRASGKEFGKSVFLAEWNSQQQVLSRILTGFPILPTSSNAHLGTICTTKVKYFFLKKQAVLKFFSTPDGFLQFTVGSNLAYTASRQWCVPTAEQFCCTVGDNALLNGLQSTCLPTVNCRNCGGGQEGGARDLWREGQEICGGRNKRNPSGRVCRNCGGIYTKRDPEAPFCYSCIFLYSFICSSSSSARRIMLLFMRVPTRPPIITPTAEPPRNHTDSSPYMLYAS